ncbi:hypothetical protein ACOMHN_036875 [Nucella lapillus]
MMMNGGNEGRTQLTHSPVLQVLPLTIRAGGGDASGGKTDGRKTKMADAPGTRKNVIANNERIKGPALDKVDARQKSTLVMCDSVCAH